jgi:hypothetical protein
VQGIDGAVAALEALDFQGGAAQNSPSVSSARRFSAGSSFSLP